MTMNDIEVVEKWKRVIDYYSDNIPPVPANLRLECARNLEKVERDLMDLPKELNCWNLARVVIPMIRRMYPFYVLERGYYSPTKGQPFHGETFEAYKILNQNYKESKYEAIPLDKKYYEDDMKSCCTPIDPPAMYPFDF